MILFTLAFAFVLGLMRWRVWVVPVLTIAAVIVDLGVGSGWNFGIWAPFDNPIFVNLVLKLTLVCTIASTLGYTAGRLIASIWRRLTRSA